MVNTKIATVDDSKSIVTLSLQLGKKMTETVAKDRIIEIAKDASQVIYLAKNDHGEALGFVYAAATVELLSGLKGRIWGLVVDEKARGLGVGRKLMQEAENWVKSKGCSVMVVNSNVLRKEAHTFYEKVGYEKYKQQIIFQKKINNKI